MASSRRAYLVAVALVVGVMIALAGVASAATPTQILKQPPFPPTDVNLFQQGVYSEASPAAPAGLTANDEATLRNQLRALLVKRFGSGSPQVSQGLAKYDATSTRAIVPSPRLRAALLALKGTAGEPAISGTLDGAFATVRFGTDCPTDAIACARTTPNGNREIVYAQRYRYENLRFLAATAAHESLHEELPTSQKQPS